MKSGLYVGRSSVVLCANDRVRSLVKLVHRSNSLKLLIVASRDESCGTSIMIEQTGSVKTCLPTMMKGNNLLSYIYLCLARGD